MKSTMNFKGIELQHRVISVRRRSQTVALALALLGTGLPAMALADNDAATCSNDTLHGKYGALVQGIRGIGPNQTEPFVGIALRNFDGNGGFVEEAASQHGQQTGPQGGVGPNASAGIGGTYIVYPNCTGTSTLVIPPSVTGLPFPLVIVSDFVIVDHGKKIKEIVTSPAANVVTAVYTKQQ